MALEAVAMVYSNVLRDHVNRVSKTVVQKNVPAVRRDSFSFRKVSCAKRTQHASCPNSAETKVKAKRERKWRRMNLMENRLGFVGSLNSINSEAVI